MNGAARFLLSAAPAAALLLLAPLHAHAGKLLDFVRETDLNDYALGLAVSTSQVPYAGSENGTLLYPYLTSFRHSAFTDNWLLIRGENMGVRFIVDDDWEFGYVGRVQTLGPGISEEPQTAGLDDRSWSVETGPLIGYRGWPVHLQFRSYWEWPNRHGGGTSELELSTPFQFGRGFFVPAVKLSYLSRAYSNYYFGVSAGEATATRPAYSAGAATNVWAGFSMGYELAPRWLVKFSLGVEHLDDEITASPLINRKRAWSGSLGVAYNNDVFNPRDYRAGRDEGPVEIRLGVFESAIDTKVRRTAADGTTGDEVDLEGLIGAAERRSVLQLGARVRVGNYHRLQLGYFELGRQSQSTLQRDVRYGDLDLPAGTETRTDIETSLLRLTYDYSILRDGQKELGVSAGIGFFEFDTTVQAVASQQSERLDAEAALPTIGAFASVPIGGRWKFSVDANVFALDFDRYEGHMRYLSLGLERRLGDAARVGLGYDLFRLRLTSSDPDQAGELDLRFHGPRLYVGAVF